MISCAKKQANSLGCETCETCETFDDWAEFRPVSFCKVSQVKIIQRETCETFSNLSQVSQFNEIGCETHEAVQGSKNVLSSKFHNFHYFHRGIVGGVSQ